MASSNNITDGLIRYLQRGDHTDLTLKCGALEYKVHKLVVCSQSTWLENAVKENRFKEGRDNVIEFPEDEVYAVRSLVHYLYSGDYTVVQKSTIQAEMASETKAKARGQQQGSHVTGFKVVKRVRPKFCRPVVPFVPLAHVNVYALADRIGLLDLKKLAVSKFSKAAESQYQSEDFHLAIARVYEVAPPGTEGQALRRQAVLVTTDHLEEIVENDVNGHFADMMAENGTFARDVALIGCGRASHVLLMLQYQVKNYPVE